jgi:ribosomal protein S18 acetylase RimI-like enzyme
VEKRLARAPARAVKEPIRLAPSDAARYVKIRRHMLEDSPWAFGSDLETDTRLGEAYVAAYLAQEEHEILAIEDGEDLVAALGVARNSRGKFRHRAIVWGVFVEPAHRRRGYGAALLAKAVERARGWPGIDYIDLAVSDGAPEARALYERFGFRVWGTEPEATQVAGRRYDEHHMTLRLRGKIVPGLPHHPG